MKYSLISMNIDGIFPWRRKGEKLNKENEGELSREDLEEIRRINESIYEVDSVLLAYSLPEILHRLQHEQNGLTRVIRDGEGKVAGFFVVDTGKGEEAYVKYFGTNRKLGAGALLRELHSLLDDTREAGYRRVSFHGWNDRFNEMLERRFGFQKVGEHLIAGHPTPFYILEFDGEDE